MYGAEASSGNLHARQTIILKDIVTDAGRSGVRIFKDPMVVNWIDTGGTIPQDGKTVGISPRLTTPVIIVDGTLVSPTRMGSQ